MKLVFEKKELILQLFDEKPLIINEIQAEDQLRDPEKYVISGYDTAIEANNECNSLIHNKCLYRTFCEVDLEEMKRIYNEFIVKKMKLKMFDIQALMASF